MKLNIAVLLIGLLAVFTLRADTLVRDGATCEIPPGYNVGPNPVGSSNILGMREWCEFPGKDFIDSLLNVCIPEDIPACVDEDRLVNGPGDSPSPVFPCIQYGE